MRIMLVAVLSLLLISGIAIAKPELEKPVPPFTSPLLATETEPNDDYTIANTLTSGDAMEAAIDPAADMDFFAITVAAGAPFSFETHPGAVDPMSDSKLYLYDVDGVTELAFDDDGGAGLFSLINYTFTVGGTYFLKVVHFSTSFTGSYVLTADAPPPPPVNATCDGAIDLQEQGLAAFNFSTCGGGNNYSPTNGCTGYSSGAAGEDIVYKIFLNMGEVFSVDITEDNYDSAIHMWTDCDDPESCVAGGDDPEEFTYTAEADGWYFLFVDGYSGCGEGLLTIAEPVGTEDATFGSIKSMFR